MIRRSAQPVPLAERLPDGSVQLDSGKQQFYYRPIIVDKPRFTIYCMAPKGESARPGHGASVNPTRLLLIDRAWRERRTTWRVPLLPDRPPWAGRGSGIPSPAGAPKHGSTKGRTRARQRSASIPCLMRCETDDESCSLSNDRSG